MHENRDENKKNPNTKGYKKLRVVFLLIFNAGVLLIIWQFWFKSALCNSEVIGTGFSNEWSKSENFDLRWDSNPLDCSARVKRWGIKASTPQGLICRVSD